MVGLTSGPGLFRDIAGLIVIKLLLLYGIYSLWFDEPVSELSRIDRLSERIYIPDAANSPDTRPREDAP